MPWPRRSRVATPSSPIRDQVVSSMDVAHIMERSDLNKVLRKPPENVEVDERDRATSFRDQSAGAPESEYRTLSSWKEEHEDETIFDSESPQQEESCRIQWSPLEIGRNVNITGNEPSPEAAGHNDGSIERATLRSWPTFGRRPHRHSFHNSKTRSSATPRSESQSSLSQSVTCTSSPSYSGPSSKSGTPEHHCRCRSFYPYAPYSRGEPARNTNGELSHSPHTFGMPTPPHSRSSSRSRSETHFKSKNTPPPPLPPLDHPVFRERVDEFGVFSTKQFFFPVADKVARNAQSLPSIAHAKKEIHSSGSISKKKARKRSQSNVGVNTQGDQMNPGAEFVRKAFHSRTSSKTSIASSRRSSAEYSAKQASSLDLNGCWEVDVSKAIISLSLQDQQVGSTRSLSSSGVSKADFARHKSAFPDQTCGDNELPNERVSGLGSPFFLQNPLPHNLISNPVSNDHSKTVKKEARDGRIKMMADGGPVTTITISSTDPATTPESTAPSLLEQAPSGRTAKRLPKSRSSTKTPPRHIEKAEGSSSLVVPQLTLIGPTPDASPISPITPTRRIHHKSTPTMPPKSILPPVIEKSYSSGSGKRKAEDADVDGDKTPPKETKEHRATFAPDPRTNRLSTHSLGHVHAPSSFNRSKRVRLTDASEGGRSTTSRTSHPGSMDGSPNAANAKNTGSWSSRGSHGPRSASFLSRDGPPLARSASRASHPHSAHQGGRAPSRRSLSQASIPISALVSPHAPSIARSGTFHMRDPRRPAPVQSTPWTLSFPTQWQAGESRWALQSWMARGGSPRHAWLFFIGFIIFPLWWLASVLPIPTTRRIGDAEKGVMLDDPQVEHDAKSWRFRCRVMALVSLITYVPFIVLIVVLTRR